MLKTLIMTGALVLSCVLFVVFADHITPLTPKFPPNTGTTPFEFPSKQPVEAVNNELHLDQFHYLNKGLTQAEVKHRLGPPDKVQAIGPDRTGRTMAIWHYTQNTANTPAMSLTFAQGKLIHKSRLHLRTRDIKWPNLKDRP